MRASVIIMALIACAVSGGTGLSAADATAAAAAPTEVSLSAVPAAVMTTLQKSSGGAGFSTITKATATDGTVTYAGTFAAGGKTSVATVKADGTLVSVTDAK
jgi:hypothetical protein